MNNRTTEELKNRTIKLCHPLGEVEYTELQLIQMQSKLSTLYEFALIMLHEDKMEGSFDTTMTKSEALEEAKKVLYDTNYCNDFIDECFEHYIKTNPIKQP